MLTLTSSLMEFLDCCLFSLLSCLFFSNLDITYFHKSVVCLWKVKGALREAMLKIYIRLYDNTLYKK